MQLRQLALVSACCSLRALGESSAKPDRRLPNDTYVRGAEWRPPQIPSARALRKLRLQELRLAYLGIKSAAPVASAGRLGTLEAEAERHRRQALASLRAAVHLLSSAELIVSAQRRRAAGLPWAHRHTTLAADTYIRVAAAAAGDPAAFDQIAGAEPGSKESGASGGKVSSSATWAVVLLLSSCGLVLASEAARGLRHLR